jgi:hypothetical protein
MCRQKDRDPVSQASSRGTFPDDLLLLRSDRRRSQGLPHRRTHDQIHFFEAFFVNEVWWRDRYCGHSIVLSDHHLEDTYALDLCPDPVANLQPPVSVRLCGPSWRTREDHVTSLERHEIAQFLQLLFGRV